MSFRYLQGFGRREDGATAVEFALIALPLVMLMFGLIEICMVFTKQGVLEYATLQAAREVRTGQIYQDGESTPEEVFQQALCNAADFLIDCNDVYYQVREMEDFAEASEEPPPEFDEDGELEDQVFEGGDANGVIMIRTVYRHPIMTPMMQPLLANGGQNTSRLMMSTVVLKTEPYDLDE